MSHRKWWISMQLWCTYAWVPSKYKFIVQMFFILILERRSSFWSAVACCIITTVKYTQVVSNLEGSLKRGIGRLIFMCFDMSLWKYVHPALCDTHFLPHSQGDRLLHEGSGTDCSIDKKECSFPWEVAYGICAQYCLKRKFNWQLQLSTVLEHLCIMIDASYTKTCGIRRDEIERRSSLPMHT